MPEVVRIYWVQQTGRRIVNVAVKVVGSAEGRHLLLLGWINDGVGGIGKVAVKCVDMT